MDGIVDEIGFGRIVVVIVEGIICGENCITDNVVVFLLAVNDNLHEVEFAVKEFMGTHVEFSSWKGIIALDGILHGYLIERLAGARIADLMLISTVDSLT